MTSLPSRSWNNTWITPTPEQQAVLESTAQAIVIQALAGTGKTTTLCMKASHLQASLGSERRLLVLAYSQAGVVAIRDRMMKLHGSVPAGLDILTIEQLCEKLLGAQGDPLEKLEDPVRRRFLILQAQLALREVLARSPDDHAAELMEHDVDIDAFLAFEALAKKKRLDLQFEASDMDLHAFCEAEDLPYGLYRLFRHYERMRVGIDHEPRFYAEGDCTFEVCRQIELLDWDQPFEALNGRYGAVLFDELHDLDEGALAVLRKLVQSGNGVFIGAGDFNQHIHEGSFSVFGGAMARIRQCLPEQTELLELNVTRRFGSEICAALNPLFDVSFSPRSENADSFQRLAYDSDEHCVDQLLALHQQIVNGWRDLQGEAAQHSALYVVLRNPQDSLLLEWALGHEGIHYGCQGLSPFYQRREVALTLALMWALLGDDTEKHLTLGIVHAAVDGVLHYGRPVTGPDGVDLDRLAQGQFDETRWTELPGASESRKLAAMLLGSATRMRQYIVHGTVDGQAAPRGGAFAEVMALPSGVLDDAGAFCEHPAVRRLFDDAFINDRERQSCRASLDRLTALARGIPVREFLGRLTLVATRSIDMHDRKENVTLRILSVEACKGREFTFVAVPFVERGRFPNAVAHEDAYRERNMLYVAMTRARSALWLLESAAKPVTPGPV